MSKANARSNRRRQTPFPWSSSRSMSFFIFTKASAICRLQGVFAHVANQLLGHYLFDDFANTRQDGKWPIFLVAVTGQATFL